MTDVVNKLWGFCHTLHHDGIDYGDYIEQLTGLTIKFPADILPLIRHYGDRKQQHFLSISINGANEVINSRVVGIGLVDKCLVHPREVFADALADRAAAIIVAHNTTTGDLQPGSEDRQLASQLQQAAGILSLNLLDYMIFNTEGYYSFTEKQEM